MINGMNIMVSHFIQPGQCEYLHPHAIRLRDPAFILSERFCHNSRYLGKGHHLNGGLNIVIQLLLCFSKVLRHGVIALQWFGLASFAPGILVAVFHPPVPPNCNMFLF